MAMTFNNLYQGLTENDVPPLTKTNHGNAPAPDTSDTTKQMYRSRGASSDDMIGVVYVRNSRSGLQTKLVVYSLVKR